MGKPTIRRVLRNNEWVWEVTLPDSTVKYHRQDWQAQWLYSYACILYKAGID
jgi:hypothetical protein